jgi:hypothetical protein
VQTSINIPSYSPVRTHAMMIEMVDALVTEFAMHGLFSNLYVTDPALLGGFLSIPVMIARAVTVGATGIMSLASEYAGIGRIDLHGHVAKVRCGTGKATE